VPTALEIPGKAAFEQAAALVESLTEANGGKFPAESVVAPKLSELRDPWGDAIRYQILNSTRARLISNGPDRKSGTQWDIGMMIDLPAKETPKEPSWMDRLHPVEPWLVRKKKELGINDASTGTPDEAGFKRSGFSGGQTRLQGAAYFQFFTWLMLGTAVAFIPYALLYRPKTYLQD
jgi:proton-dependent oligopeptide transporter, POT family